MVALIVDVVFYHNAAIKMILEDFMDFALCDFLFALRPEALLVDGIRDAVQIIISGRIQLKNSFHRRSCFGIYGNSPIAFVVLVSERSHIRPPAMFQFCAVAAHDILPEITDVLIRHAKLNGSDQSVVIRIVVPIRRFNLFDDALLEKPLYFSVIHRIPCKAIQFPDKDNAITMLFRERHHLGEFRTARFFRRHGFLVDFANF